jgi:hypothetical protein
LPHAQSDRDVAHLAMLTARIKGRELDTGVGFAPTESSTTHKGNRSSPACTDSLGPLLRGVLSMKTLLSSKRGGTKDPLLTAGKLGP